VLVASQSLQEMRVIEELMHEEVARRDLSLRELQQQHKELRSSHAALQRKTVRPACEGEATSFTEQQRELDEDNVRMRWQADELAGQLEGMATGAERKFRRAPLPEVEDLDLSPWRSLQGGGESCY